MALSGKFADTPFSDVISDLSTKKSTGVLTCRSDSTEKCIYMDQGQIIFATSRDERDRLGEVMVRSGQITRDQLEKALQIHKRSAGLKKLGVVFVECGYILPKDLFKGLNNQVREIIHSLFLLTEGSYRFEDHLPADVIRLQIDMEVLLREVIQLLKQGI